MKTTFLLSLLFSFVVCLPLSAQDQAPQLSTDATLAIPSKISYQGVLTDNAGVPQNGTFTMGFGLYTVPTGGSPLWSETQNTVQVTNGIFNVLLGTSTPISLPFDVPYYLQVSIQGTALLPRIELASSGYSLNTARIQGRSVSTNSPSSGQVLKWTGSEWAPSTDQTGGVTLPFSGTTSTSTASLAFEVILDGNSGSDAAAISGQATGSTGPIYGVYGRSASSNLGVGTLGWATASTGDTYGVYGRTNSNAGSGVFGIATSTSSSGERYGVQGRTPHENGVGVFGWNQATSGTSIGVAGRSNSTTGRGVHGLASATSGTNYGVWGGTSSTNGYGVYSLGRFAATGTKDFQIDHPLDPANKYLNHFSAEGPEPYLLYRGTVILDATGQAWVHLPTYFEAINRDFHYQLTPIGNPAPDLHIAKEVTNNQFLVAGGIPGLKVSWTVMGIRNDPYVRNTPLADVQDKPSEFRGTYLHPEYYGLSAEMSQFYQKLGDNQSGGLLNPDHK